MAADDPQQPRAVLRLRDDLDVLLAAPLGADLPAGDPIPETCGKVDPLSLSAPDEDDPPPPEEDVWDD